MFKQVFRLTFLALIWKRYRRGILFTAVLLLFFWLVNFAHSEYLSFAKLQEQTENIGLSFFIKWTSLVFGLIIYLLAIVWQPSRSVDTKPKKKIIAASVDANEPDPFAAIREKERLRTRTEIMLEEEERRLNKKE